MELRAVGERAVLVGLLASRFLKASHQREESSHDEFGVPRGTNRPNDEPHSPLSSGGTVDLRPEAENPGVPGRMGGVI